MPGRLLPILLLSLLPTAGLGQEAEPAQPAPAPAEADPAQPAPAPLSPRAEFQAICRQVREGDFPWYGRGPAEELRRQLAAGPADLDEEIRLRSYLGIQLLQVDRPAAAIEELSRALSLSDARDPEDSRRWGAVWYLGLAYMQLAEDQNCIERHTAASCILPLLPEGVHGRPQAAAMASEYFLQVLQHEPRQIQAAWLFSLTRMLAGAYPEGVPEPLRPKGLEPEVPDFPRWLDRGPELGINVYDLAGGAIMDDFDGDGFLDLVTSTWDSCDHMKAFRNDGRGGFEEVTEVWGLDEQLGGLNVVHADYDDDGDLDLLVLRGGWMLEYGRIRSSLLRNDLNQEAGRFVDVTRAAGLAEPAYPTQAALWADYDGDGDLDLYVANEATSDFQPFPSQLFRNNGDGTFTDVAPRAGVTNDRYAKSAAWGDYDGDGDPDLYVSNIGPNRLYRNDGDGTFTDVAGRLGVTEPRGRSFAAWFFDHDNDGDLDLLVNDYGAQLPVITASYYGFPPGEGHALLYRNDGGRFTEVSRQVGLVRPTLPMGSNYGDLDNDGWLDVYLGTGDPRYAAVMPNVAYRNTGGAFQEITFASGLGHLQKGHGVAFGDVDHDGDQDLFHQLGGFYPGDDFGNALFENPGPARQWITLLLVGEKANRFGVGARIEARVRQGEERRSVHLTVGNGGSFGGSSLRAEMGLGEAEALEELIVRWPGSGTVDRLKDVPMNRFYRLVEGSGALVPVELPRIRLGAGGPAPPRHHDHSDG